MRYIKYDKSGFFKVIIRCFNDFASLIITGYSWVFKGYLKCGVKHNFFQLAEYIAVLLFVKKVNWFLEVLLSKQGVFFTRYS